MIADWSMDIHIPNISIVLRTFKMKLLPILAILIHRAMCLHLLWWVLYEV